MKGRSYYMRCPELVIVTSRDNIFFVGSDGTSINHESRNGAEWSRLMQLLANPTIGTAVQSVTGAFSEPDIDLLGRLVAAGLRMEAGDLDSLAAVRDRVFFDNRSFHLVPAEPVCRHLVVGCTGSVVAGLIPPTLLSLCYSRFQHRLDVILTEAAQKFVTRDLFESYGICTWVHGFERRDDIYVPHVHLGRSADCVLVMPASANSLHRIADGACTDLLSTLVAATQAPVVLAPVMNDAMWNSQAIQRNVQRLRKDGMYIVEPTIIFGAADLAKQGQPMYGGHGTLWSGPCSLMQALKQILRSRGAPFTATKAGLT